MEKTSHLDDLSASEMSYVPVPDDLSANVDDLSVDPDNSEGDEPFQFNDIDTLAACAELIAEEAI